MFFRKCLKVPKIVAQCRKWAIPHLCTLRPTIVHALLIAIGYLNTCIPYLNTCITYLNTLSWLSAPNLNTLNRHDSATNQNRTPENPRHPIKIEHLSRQRIRIEHYVTRELSAANQNRVLSLPSRQPIRIEHYVNESSQLGLKTLLGSRLAIAYLNT